MGGGRISDSAKGSGDTESSLLTVWLGNKCAGRARSDGTSRPEAPGEACFRRLIALVVGDDRAVRVEATLEVGFSFLRLFRVAGGSELRSTGEDVVLVEA